MPRTDQTPDWVTIKRLFETSPKSIREIARDFDISDTALRKHALKEGWERKGPH